MLKILVTYAVQGEFVELKWPDIEPYYVRTGIGKVKSAFHLAEAIRQVQPDLVLNIGSAGTVNHQVGDIFVCRKFVDRDMQKMAEFGLECEIDSSALQNILLCLPERTGKNGKRNIKMSHDKNYDKIIYTG